MWVGRPIGIRRCGGVGWRGSGARPSSDHPRSFSSDDRAAGGGSRRAQAAYEGVAAKVETKADTDDIRTQLGQINGRLSEQGAAIETKADEDEALERHENLRPPRPHVAHVGQVPRRSNHETLYGPIRGSRRVRAELCALVCAPHTGGCAVLPNPNPNPNPTPLQQLRGGEHVSISVNGIQERSRASAAIASSKAERHRRALRPGPLSCYRRRCPRPPAFCRPLTPALATMPSRSCSPPAPSHRPPLPLSSSRSPPAHPPAAPFPPSLPHPPLTRASAADPRLRRWTRLPPLETHQVDEILRMNETVQEQVAALKQELQGTLKSLETWIFEQNARKPGIKLQARGAELSRDDRRAAACEARRDRRGRGGRTLPRRQPAVARRGPVAHSPAPRKRSPSPEVASCVTSSPAGKAAPRQSNGWLGGG